ncbi:integrase [Streptomyces sp. NPDC049040]|uniref:integrase n=1 Tax=Streptomyces sp. NPDC049040 TaxID=3365593 RepID=UPI00371FBA42
MRFSAPAGPTPADEKSWTALILNHRHLLDALREFEQFHNENRAHQGIASARPLHPLPPPITNTGLIDRLDIRKHDRLGGILHEYRHAA